MHLTQKLIYSLMSLLVAGVLAGCQSTTPHTSKHSPGGVLLVCNKGNHTLGIIDPVAGKQIATVDEDVTGREVRVRAGVRKFRRGQAGHGRQRDPRD
jgi:hypothetical protein